MTTVRQSVLRRCLSGAFVAVTALALGGCELALGLGDLKDLRDDASGPNVAVTPDGDVSNAADAEPPQGDGPSDVSSGGRSGTGDGSTAGASGSTGSATGSTSGGASGFGTGGASSGTSGTGGASSGTSGTGGIAGGNSGGLGTSGASGADMADASAAHDADVAGGAPPRTDLATRALCTGVLPIVCHFGGAPGDYGVTVVLGGGAAAGDTEVEGETNRQLLGHVLTAPGATQRLSFGVNVRQPESQPLDADSGVPGLDLYFYGALGGPGEDDAAAGATDLPQLASIGYAQVLQPVVIYLTGDSVTADLSSPSYAGWGQMLPALFDYPVSVANDANQGQSIVSYFANANLWSVVLSRMKRGDYVFLEFGHDDMNTLATTFHDNLTTMVMEATAVGAYPVIVTPPARATFSGATLTPQFQTATLDVVATMKQVASERSVPLLDVTALTTAWYNQLGPTGWQAFHASGDVTHTNRAGAAVVAGFVSTAIRAQNLGLTKYLR